VATPKLAVIGLLDVADADAVERDADLLGDLDHAAAAGVGGEDEDSSSPMRPARSPARSSLSESSTARSLGRPVSASVAARRPPAAAGRPTTRAASRRSRTP
jgi:hypothetical protein